MFEKDKPAGSPRSVVTRRFLIAALPVGLAGCVSANPMPRMASLAPPRQDPMYVSMYGPMPGEPFRVPAVDLSKIDPVYYRRQIEYPTTEAVGTIIVDPQDKFLYLVQPEGMAMRYGIGVGREGFGWSGRATIRRKAAWPTWTPPKEMIERDPETAKWANGMPGGINNPLGARALYLYQGGRDTLYRIHGTNEQWSIGRNVSSGCIRLLNQDIIDLHARVPIGSEVVVMDSTYPVG